MLGIVTKDTCENQHFNGRLLSWWPVAPTSSTWCSCCHLNPPVSVEGMDIPMINFWSAVKNVCNIEYLVTQPVSPGNPGRCHGTCCQPYRPGIWRSGDHPSLQARALSQKGYCSNEWDGCIEVYIYIYSIYVCIYLYQWRISNVRSYKALARHMQQLYNTFWADSSMCRSSKKYRIYGPFPLWVCEQSWKMMLTHPHPSTFIFFL